ncbi:hypothetical protein BLOT_003021 [Blomia tropicalis]|nr:hypothetical protein BLOT_003021 [Blomia tropicalis]
MNPIRLNLKLVWSNRPHLSSTATLLYGSYHCFLSAFSLFQFDHPMSLGPNEQSLFNSGHNRLEMYSLVNDGNHKTYLYHIWLLFRSIY